MHTGPSVGELLAYNQKCQSVSRERSVSVSVSASASGSGSGSASGRRCGSSVLSRGRSELLDVRVHKGDMMMEGLRLNRVVGVLVSGVSERTLYVYRDAKV